MSGIDKTMKNLSLLFIPLFLFTPFINFLNFDERLLDLGEFYFYGITILIAFYICTHAIFKKEDFIFNVRTVDIFCFSLVLFILGRYSLTDTFSFTSHPFLRILIITIVYIIFNFYINIKNPLFISILLTSFSITGIVLSIHCILQFFNIISSNSYFDILSVFRNPSILTNYLCTILPLSFSVLKGTGSTNVWGRVLKYTNFISFILICIVLLLTKERTGWIACLGGIGAVAIIKNQNLLFKLKRVIRSPFQVISLLLIFVICSLSVSYLLYTLKPQSVLGRIFIYGNTLNIIKDNFLFGVGYDKFQSVYNLYQSQYFLSNPQDLLNQLIADNIKTPFNEYLLIWAELGIFGLLLLLLIIKETFNNGFLILNRINERLLRIGALGSFVSILLCALFSYPFNEISILINILVVSAIIHSNQAAKYTLLIRHSYVKVLSVIGLVALTCICYCVILLFSNQKKWEQAALYAQKGYFNSNVYENLYPVLQSNEHFLYNYGVELLMDGEYIKSIKILEEAKRYSVNTDILLYLADGYKAIKNYTKAEELYLLSMNMVPKKFIPKHALMELYDEMGNCTKANIWAKKILKKKIQIPSKEVYLIMQQANKILEKKCN